MHRQADVKYFTVYNKLLVCEDIIIYNTMKTGIIKVRVFDSD